MRIDIPGGGWAELRDPDMITVRQRKPLLECMGVASKYDESPDGGMAAIGAVNSALILAFVESWSLPAPVTADGLEELPARVYDALARQCMPLVSALLPDFGPTPDPESPTAPSNA